MAHGYLGDGYGLHGDFDEDRERDWRERGENWRDRGRGAMFGGSDRDDRWSGRGRRSDEFGTAQGDRFEGRRSFSANPDDHYRSWRDRHMSELDRDYADYCREREQQFHSDFDSWRRTRHGNPQPLRTGMTQSGISHDPTGELQLETEATPPVEPDPMADATLGTNGPEEGRTGRRR
jgi:hypothetical protein